MRRESRRGRGRGWRRRGEDEAFGEELADDAGTAGAESAAHGELLGAGGGASEQQVGEVDAGDEQDRADGGPKDDERAAKLAADVVLERHGDDAAFDHCSRIGAAGLWDVCCSSTVGRGDFGLVLRLGERDAGLEAADHGDDVAPVAGRAVEVERGDGVDLCAGGEDGAEVEASGQDADDGGLGAVHVEGLADDVGVGVELRSPPGVGDEDDGRGAVESIFGRKTRPMAGWTPRTWKKLAMTSMLVAGMGAPPRLRLRLSGPEKAK